MVVNETEYSEIAPVSGFELYRLANMTASEAVDYIFILEPDGTLKIYNKRIAYIFAFVVGVSLGIGLAYFLYSTTTKILKILDKYKRRDNKNPLKVRGGSDDQDGPPPFYQIFKAQKNRLNSILVDFFFGTVKVRNIYDHCFSMEDIPYLVQNPKVIAVLDRFFSLTGNPTLDRILRIQPSTVIIISHQVYLYAFMLASQNPLLVNIQAFGRVIQIPAFKTFLIRCIALMGKGFDVVLTSLGLILAYTLTVGHLTIAYVVPYAVTVMLSWTLRFGNYGLLTDLHCPKEVVPMSRVHQIGGRQHHILDGSEIGEQTQYAIAPVKDDVQSNSVVVASSTKNQDIPIVGKPNAITVSKAAKKEKFIPLSKRTKTLKDLRTRDVDPVAIERIDKMMEQTRETVHQKVIMEIYAGDHNPQA